MQDDKQQSPIDWPAVFSGVVAGLIVEILIRLIDIILKK